MCAFVVSKFGDLPVPKDEISAGMLERRSEIAILRSRWDDYVRGRHIVVPGIP